MFVSSSRFVLIVHHSIKLSLLFQNSNMEQNYAAPRTLEGMEDVNMRDVSSFHVQILPTWFVFG